MGRPSSASGGIGIGIGIGCLVLIVCMVISAPHHAAESALTCGSVGNAISPCLTYARTGGAVVPQACCNGVRSLYSAAKTTSDRQFVCNCLKGLVGSSSFPYAPEIPGKCGVSVPYKISPSTDCTKVT